MYGNFELPPQKAIKLESKSSLSGFIGNMGIIIAAITILCTCAMFFTDISLASVVTAEFSLSFAILLFCSYTMYFSMADTGARRACSDEQYIKAKEKYEQIRHELQQSGAIFTLDGFCHRYIAYELEMSQRNLLLSAGISYEKFCELYKGKSRRALPSDMSREEKRIILRASRLKPIHLTPDMLLSVGGSAHSRSPLKNTPEKKRVINMLCALIPTTVTSFFAVSVVCSVISDPSIATLTECLVKLFALVWNGCKGYTMGYNNISRDACAYLSDRCDLLYAASQQYEQKAATPEAAIKKEAQTAEQKISCCYAAGN